MSKELRIQGRNLAKTLLAMAELSHQPQDVLDGFWDEIRTVDPITTDKPATSSSAMTDDQATVFERSTIEFGQYKGQRFKDIPMEYLEWLADKSIQLRRYIQSSRAQRRVG